MLEKLYPVSVSKNSRSLDPRCHGSFDKIDTPFRALPSVLMGGVWSPIQWTGGVRQSHFYQSTSLIALDFDSGDSIEDVKEVVDSMGLGYIIGTTKSHQKEKVNAKTGAVTPPRDRFRLVIPATECLDAGDYRYTMGAIMDSLFPSADKACKDQARYFYPCTAIAHLSEGKSLGFMKRPADDIEDEARQRDRFSRRLKAVEKTYHRLPRYVKKLVSEYQDNRSGSIVKVASAMYQSGWTSADEIASELHARKSPLITLIQDRGKAEFLRCIQSGIRRATGD